VDPFIQSLLPPELTDIGEPVEAERLRFLGGERDLEGVLDGERDLLSLRAGLRLKRRAGEGVRRLGGGDKDPSLRESLRGGGECVLDRMGPRGGGERESNRRRCLGGGDGLLEGVRLRSRPPGLGLGLLLLLLLGVLLWLRRRLGGGLALRLR